MASGAPADRRRPALEAFGHSPGGRLKTAGAHKPSESALAAFSPFPKLNSHFRGTDPAGRNHRHGFERVYSSKRCRYSRPLPISIDSGACCGVAA